MASGTPVGFFDPAVVVVFVGVVEGAGFTTEWLGEVGVGPEPPSGVWLCTSGERGVVPSGVVPRWRVVFRGLGGKGGLQVAAVAPGG